ncbi:MAG: HAD family hydrolase [Syntrophobacteraceae bacterium]|nr:HAD family hydrolase [Syntrophobacteraceae bacterium]
MLAWLKSAKAEYDRFILLDRDGVLNVNRADYVKTLAEVSFYPDALRALALLEQKGVGVILISNQSGINRGLIGWEDFFEIHEAVIGRAEECGGAIQAAFYCPHRPDEKCECRKPSPAMIFAACRFAGIEPGQTFFVGDSATDILAAENAGCRGVRICRADSRGTGALAPVEPSFTTLLDAVLSIYGKNF